MGLLYIRKGDTGPEEEDLLALVPVDEHDTIQMGDLIGNIQRTEDELVFNNPRWVDDEGNEFQGTADIEQKVPIPLRQGLKTKRLWIGRDKGSHIDIVSASTLISEKIPKRWDLPLIDARRIIRHLEGPRTGNSLTNLLGTKMGIMTVLGIFGFASFFTYFLIFASGHGR